MGNSRIIAITTFNPASAIKSNTQDENSRHMHIKKVKGMKKEESSEAILMEQAKDFSI